jgi:ribosomal protein S18 acetylase RimI-like enzyme
VDGLTVEPLTEANVDELVAFLDRVDQTYFNHPGSDALGFLAEPEDVHVLGRSEGTVVAFGMLRGWHEGYATPSLGLAVARDSEGRGFGRAMMAQLERLARERGARDIRLRVHPANERARRVYEGSGYRSIGMERGQVLMLLEL